MAAEAAQQPFPAQVVGNAFVQQYYYILHRSPGLVHRFYQDISQLGRPEGDGSMNITTTMQAINEKIISLNYEDLSSEIKSVYSQESHSGGVQVFVTGYLTGKDNAIRSFAQTFFLAPQAKGYFVLNDMVQYVDTVNVNSSIVTDVVVPVVPEPVIAPPVQENHVSEKSSPSSEEAFAGEVYNPPEIVEEEVPVAEVLDEKQDVAAVVVECSAKIEEQPKKSYASIVMDFRENAASFSLPPAAHRKALLKKVEQVTSTLSSANQAPVPNVEPADNGSNQEADGYSVYIGNLPMDATHGLLEKVFLKFGTIKSDGVQVRNNKQQNFCFGFVEFEEESSMIKAMEASPLKIDGHQVFVHEKRSNIRVNNTRRFLQPGKDSGFRNEGIGGHGNNVGGKSFNKENFNDRNEYENREDFYGRNEYVNRGKFNGRALHGYRRGNYRGGFGNREANEKPDNNFNNNGGYMNRAGGIANGGDGAKSTATRVPLTASTNSRV